MTKPVPVKKEVSIKDLAQTILKGSVDGKDSIIDYLSTSQLHLKDVRSLHAVLRGKGPQSDELLNLLHSHPTLKPLPIEERILFYYGYLHPALLSSAVKSIYYELDQAQDEQVPVDVKNALEYLSRACGSKTDFESITRGTLKAFGQAKNLEDFSSLLRPYFFITDEFNKGKNDALLAIVNKLKSKTPTKNLALSLIGIWFQTKTQPISLKRIKLAKSVFELQAMLEEFKTSKAQPAELCKIIWIRAKDIMHNNVRVR